ncbi:MAG: leucyl/phenylalanyl-tRNA--protein transferase [Acidobacteria bacterium]|jgi:leucyl/phenylalanyl-tRNA--protein transferase|nr:MAG: leucyl/phenylalanyl-tRNA--protein transferase [Acidobacteriota bacterium]GIU83117.1 MAG: leucyl/phenylalanyl-tRNA--protein transferase [Pyrinomonadaceae bacterium]
MKIIEFPDPDFCSGDIVCITERDCLNSENLIRAYKKGIFPWPISEYRFLPWFCPEFRAILEFDELHIPRSLRKAAKKSRFTFTIDRAFYQVINCCAQVKRKGQRGTWIIKEIIESYTELHHLGYAHSVEVWDENQMLVGGLYGVDAGGVFSGESMFHYVTHASKLALLFLIDHLKSRGATWIDTQMLTPHLEILGAKEISRSEFLKKLKNTQKLNLKLF